MINELNNGRYGGNRVIGVGLGSSCTSGKETTINDEMRVNIEFSSIRTYLCEKR
jgi:hypothetical protein